MPPQTPQSRKSNGGRPRSEDKYPDLAARAVAVVESGLSLRDAERLGLSRRSISRMLNRQPADFAPVKNALARQWAIHTAGMLAHIRPEDLNPMQRVIAAGIGTDKLARLTESSQQSATQVNVQVLNQVQDVRRQVSNVLAEEPSPTPISARPTGADLPPVDSSPPKLDTTPPSPSATSPKSLS